MWGLNPICQQSTYISYLHASDFLYLQDRSGEGKTIFDVYASDVSILPIMDFAPKDYGADGQEFGFEAGPVCFF